MIKAIVNVKVILENGILEQGAVVFDKTILAVIPEVKLCDFSIDRLIDGGGHWLSPGFIDIHIHGCAGHDTMDENDGALPAMSSALPATGVTAFLAATMTMEEGRIRSALERIKRSRELCAGAKLLGCHLEGPFISPRYKGAQAKSNMTKPSFELIEDYHDIIKLVTMAPELDGSYDFIKSCKEQGIAVAMGHTQASYEQCMTALEMGAGGFTHVFNAMSPMNHRQPGAVGAALDSEGVCELIADNVHVHPAAQRLLVRAKGMDKVILITDAMRGCLMAEGRYELGGSLVQVRNGAARLEDGTLAGSILTLNKAVWNLHKNINIEIENIVKFVTINPAKYLGIYDRIGSITEGKEADLIIFDEKINIMNAYVKGEEIYES